MYQVLNGPTYSENDRPSFWENEQPLMLDDTGMTMHSVQLAHAPLDEFPLIEDFEVLLEFYYSDFGYHVRFFSSVRGFIASFPWWDHAEHSLIKDGFTIPLGSFEHPAHDVEQGWEILIAAKDDLVYVLEGDFDNPSAGYSSWFKVRQDVYLAEWQKAIAACREAFLTDDQ